MYFLEAIYKVFHAIHCACMTEVTLDVTCRKMPLHFSCGLLHLVQVLRGQRVSCPVNWPFFCFEGQAFLLGQTSEISCTSVLMQCYSSTLVWETLSCTVQGPAVIGRHMVRCRCRERLLDINIPGSCSLTVRSQTLDQQ